MGFLKNLFKKDIVQEEYSSEKFAIPAKIKPIPEYHKCPVCGHENKTKEDKIAKCKEKYLDGQIKVSIKLNRVPYSYLFDFGMGECWDC